MPSFVQKRLAVHQDWFGDIPLKNIWGISFETRNGGSLTSFGEGIYDLLLDYSPATYPSFLDNLGVFEAVSDDTGGMLLAQSVAMPSESFSTSTVGANNNGGFLQGQVGGQRSAPAKLSVGFLETNIDVFENFFRPWMVAASFKGLIEDGGPEVKCNVNVVQYSKSKESGPNSDISVRKMTTFYDCVPTNIVEDRISYGEMSVDEIIREVDFIYSHYAISTP